MKLAVLAIAILALTGCKTTLINGQFITDYGDGVEIPERARPNEATKRYYPRAQNYWISKNIRRGRGYRIAPLGNAEPFQTQANPPSKKLQKEFETGFLLSYLYYDNGVVKYDGLPVQGRFKQRLDNDTYFFTHSTGKGITSYIVGHAICDRYIESINEPVDWPAMSKTLYQGQPVIDLLNMSAGDAHLMLKGTARWIGHPSHHRGLSLSEVAIILEETEKRGSGVRYNNTLTDLIANYTEFKTGEEYDELVRKIFQDKAKKINPGTCPLSAKLELG